MATYPEHLVQSNRSGLKQWGMTIPLNGELSSKDMELFELITGVGRGKRGDYTLASGG